VQGVGFRPTVWRLARRLGLRGTVANDGLGVIIHVGGPGDMLDAFAQALALEAPPLARIERISREAAEAPPEGALFRIAQSVQAPAGDWPRARAAIVPDLAVCPDCLAQVLDPRDRRFRYPFTSCTHCGPRWSVSEGLPFDRAATTLRRFPMCAACSSEYRDPADRRFHAQTISCPACGPRLRLERSDGSPVAADAMGAIDAIDAACTLLQQGRIVAIKSLGGFQLACDAADEAALARLRERKRRAAKPFALMARDLAVAHGVAQICAAEQALLASAASPIVLLPQRRPWPLAAGVAPGLAAVGLMLPCTPLQHLLLQRLDRPIVLTSGNLGEEPQCIDNKAARETLGGVADFFLLHELEIAHRLDDSVAMLAAAAPRLLRRARGFTPAPIRLPAGFERAPPVLALGGELKNTICIASDGEAVVSHHLGDLEGSANFAAHREAVADYTRLCGAGPAICAIDAHPDYLSGAYGREWARRPGRRLLEVQHHHAHVAACMAENGIALEAGAVLGIALDGLGYGENADWWGGEFLLADYRACRRLATFKPVAMPGGALAMREPWRNTYAQLMAGTEWPRFAMEYSQLELFAFLDAKPRQLLDEMIAGGVNSPRSSSCGRLFDAVAAALGLCRERVLYEGQAAMALEAAADAATLCSHDEESAYPFAIAKLQEGGLPYVEPLAMWRALLGDLVAGTPVPVMAARFHKGLAIIITRMVEQLRRAQGGVQPFAAVALTGGVFQNRILLEQLCARLAGAGLLVLTHRLVPANDAGLSLGQAAVAAARALS
jgi:hydrogenase maturation protein HypF